MLIFEYATAMGLKDPEFILEGRAMLEGMLDDFNQLHNFNPTVFKPTVFKNEKDKNPSENPSENPLETLLGTDDFLEVNYLIDKNLLEDYYFKNWNLCKPLTTNFSSQNYSEFENWLKANISNFDTCMFVAAEENLELYKITHLIENSGVQVVGSTSEAILTCSDKFKTYQHLNKHMESTGNSIPLVNTYELDLNYIDEEDISKIIPSEYFNRFSKIFSNNKKMIIKPADGVACQGIKILNSLDDLSEYLLEYLKNFESILPYVLIQDFIEGQPCSVSLLSDGIRAIPISLNLQKIEFSDYGVEYCGGEVPWDHPLRDEAMNVAQTVVESIPGLKGYVGVDLILSDNEIYVIEINSRLTTPYVALKDLTDFNLGLAVFNAVNGNIIEEFNISGSIKFEKSSKKLNIIRKN